LQGFGSVLGSDGCGFSKGREWGPAAVPARSPAETDIGVGAPGNGVIWYWTRLRPDPVAPPGCPLR